MVVITILKWSFRASGDADMGFAKQSLASKRVPKLELGNEMKSP
jgi:hypothetical protein